MTPKEYLPEVLFMPKHLTPESVHQAAQLSKFINWALADQQNTVEMN